MRPTHGINAVLLTVFFVGSALAWPALPEHVPVHFGVDGEPDRWATRSLASWFAMPLVALVIGAFNYVVAALLPRRPKWINLPNKERFLALPGERRAAVIRQMQGMLHGLTAPTVAVLAAVQVMIYRRALGTPGEHDLLVVLLLTVLLTPLVLIVWIPKVQREQDRQLREHRAAGAEQGVGR